MMETKMPDGLILREMFEIEETMNKRRKELEDLGGQVQRVLHVYRSKYEPHQGKKEIQRRLKKMKSVA
jgi:hypothetical protein